MTGLVREVRTMARGWRWGRRPVIPRSAERWVPDPEPREFPTEWARSPVAAAVRAAVQRRVLKPLVWSQVGVSVEGLDRIADLPAPAVFVSNHASHLDAPLVLCSLPDRFRRRTAVGAAADYFFDVWWRAAGTALVFNAFPIERTGGRRVTSLARELVTEGWNLVVFPEGTRSPDGWVQRFRPGAARLCMDLGIPAVPIAIRGAYAAMPRGRGWPRPGRQPISVRYGRPMLPAEGEDGRSFLDRMTKAVARLWEEDAGTWWEAERRATRGETERASGPEGPRWLRVWESSRGLPRPGRPRAWL